MEKENISWSNWEGIPEVESQFKNEKIEILTDKLVKWYSSIRKGDFSQARKELLTREELAILDCSYRSGFDGISCFLNEKGEPTYEHRIWITLPVKGQQNPISLLANNQGVIRDNSLEEIIEVLNISLSKDEISSIVTIKNLEEFLINNSQGKINFKNLSNIIEKNINAKNLRSKIIEYVAFRLNYSNSIYGSMLAKRFIKDMKNHYGNEEKIINQERLIQPKIRLKKRNMEKGII